MVLYDMSACDLVKAVPAGMDISLTQSCDRVMQALVTRKLPERPAQPSWPSRVDDVACCPVDLGDCPAAASFCLLFILSVYMVTIADSTVYINGIFFNL